MIRTEEIEYFDGNVVCRGFVAYEDSIKKPRPCVLIAPDWSGRNTFFCDKAKQLAAKGYIGFAVDVYGNNKLGHTNDEKIKLLNGILKDRKLVTTRMHSAFMAASALPFVDAAKMAAIGYCFGGLCVLDLARAGAELKGVVSFHGNLTAPPSPICKRIQAKILVLHGYDDPMVPPKQVQQFAREMTEMKADWQIYMYGHTKHGFTNPEAHDDALGLRYNPRVDQRSWLSTELFLQEIFNSRPSRIG